MESYQSLRCKGKRLWLAAAHELGETDASYRFILEGHGGAQGRLLKKGVE